MRALDGHDCSRDNTASVICSGKRQDRAIGTQDAPGVKCPQEQRVKEKWLQKSDILW